MALYMNGQEISQSSGVPIAVGGLTAVNEGTPSNISGLVKGNGSTLQAAQAGMDYATPEQAKPFVVTFTLDENGTITADKTVQEIITAHEAGQMVLGITLHVTRGAYILLQLSSVQGPEPRKKVTFTAFNTDSRVDMVVILGINRNGVDQFFIGDINLTVNPASATALPASGTALTANTIYAVADVVGTYAFTPPESGWAHGTFTTGSSASVSFVGTFLGTAPSIEASKTYEFDVYNGVWAVQEVVSA